MAMSANVERIIHEVRALSDEERREFFLIFGEGDESVVDATWLPELERRARELDDGKVGLVDEETFLEKLRFR